MKHFNIFDGPHLIDNLEYAIARHCQVEISADGTPCLRYRGVSGIRLLPGVRMMTLLPEQLNDFVRSGSAGTPAPALLSGLMAGVAILAGHADVAVAGPVGSEKQLSLLKSKITTDFALTCALSLAHDRGYPVLPDESLWGVLHEVLTVKDDDSLRRLFRDSLARVQPAQEERQFFPGRRSLSSRSYWNLTTAAEMHDWDDSVRLRLIEEYLSPAPRRHSIGFSGTEVSAGDWKRLYDSLFDM